MKEGLKITGVLNFKKFSTMGEPSIKAFLLADANKLCSELVRLDFDDDPEIEAAHNYELKAEYILLDSYYNKHGKVEASLVWSRNNGAELHNYKVIKE